MVVVDETPKNTFLLLIFIVILILWHNYTYIHTYELCQTKVEKWFFKNSTSLVLCFEEIYRMHLQLTNKIGERPKDFKFFASVSHFPQSILQHHQKVGKIARVISISYFSKTTLTWGEGDKNVVFSRWFSYVVSDCNSSRNFRAVRHQSLATVGRELDDIERGHQNIRVVKGGH